jgi:chromosome segregation ATPase
MKKTLLALVIPVMLLAAACNQGKEEISKLKTTNDSLVSISRAKDSMVNDFVSSFNEIQSNLDSIKMKEKIISNTTSGSSELKTRSKDQINSDINQIYRMQQENKAMLATLRSKLKTSGVKIDQLQTMIDNLDKQIESKDVEIAQLKDDLTKLNVQVTDLTTKVTDLNTNVETLNAVNKEKEEVIQNKTAELNTAYYVIGTTSYLKDKKIVTKEGGFIGLGKTKELTPDIDKSALTKVDITQLSAIPIMKSKVTLLTAHPKSSYRLTGKNMADSLVITNPKEFWSLSKVLVVNVK